jgi:hypothetical protein
VAGSSGGAVGGGSGGATAGTGGAGTAGGRGGGSAGTGGSGTAGAGGATGLGPLRLIVFYTRWGTTYPEWFPSGDDRNFTLTGVLQPLVPHKSDVIVVSGLTNASRYTLADGTTTLSGANPSGGGDALATLLTARPPVSRVTAGGPSLDEVVGDCGGAAGPPLRLAVGQLGWEDETGVSFAADGTPRRGDRHPNEAAVRVLGHTVNAPDPAANIDAVYPAVGAAHMDVAVEALATGKTCAVTLMWGDQVAPLWLNLSGLMHDLSHFANSLYNSVVLATPPPSTANHFVRVQTWYAEQFASLLARLKAVPVGAGTLLDRSVVLWISDSGSGADHTGYFIPVVIAGGGGRLDVGRFVQTKMRPVPIPDVTTVGRTQGDLLAALARLWGIASFGDPAIARQPLTEILKP